MTKKSLFGGNVVKVPMVMQLEALECGAACLTMILAYYGKWMPLEQIRSDCGVSRDGSSAKNIAMAANYYGLKTKGYRFEPEELREFGAFPCIIHWDFNHFVVLDGFRGNKAYLNDPGRGTYSVSIEDFDKSFTGVCLCFEPTEAFVPSGKPKSVLEFAYKRIKESKTAIIFTILCAVISAMISIISPGFTRIFYDRLITGANPTWVRSVMIMWGILMLVQIVNTAITSQTNMRLSGKMSAVGSSTYLWKVLHLPMNFFSQRMAGDIQGRMSSNASIANTLVNTLSPLVLQCGMVIFYLVVMLRYSWLLTLVGLSSLTINAVVSTLVSKRRVNISRIAMRDAAKLNSTTAAGIEMVETIKASGAENGFFGMWAGYQASVNAQQVKELKINQYLGAIPALVTELANYVVLLMGVFMAINGQFTVGMIMAFSTYLSSFMGPASTIISAGQMIQEMRTQMERIDDVMEYPNDDVFADELRKDGEAEEEEEYNKLSGSIELKHVVFGYSKLDKPLIRDFNLSVKPGHSVAIVGGSGCGKSTMSKLISGLYQPWSGEILFDGKPMSKINKSVFKGSLAVVDQDIILFEDTIENNIKMWDESIEDFEMILAARDAQLHEDIMKRPGGYSYKLVEGGKDFSGGQRQRMEIARVLAQEPTIIILDEATSALDAKTEYEVVKSICRRGITCIVVAHRLSTIRSCDEIIVMQQGEIIDRGTHKELMNSSELYRELVTSE